MIEPSASKQRVVLVDDEHAAIINLRNVLDGFERLEVVAEARDGNSAVQVISETRPDIVFLDIEMPGVNGFEVARQTADLSYQLVFVTAYSQYALDAFDTNALDYLLKPVRPSLVEKCVQKMLHQEELILEALQQRGANPDALVLSDGRVTRVVDPAHVCFIEGRGRHRRVHLGSEGIRAHNTSTIVSDTTLDDFEMQLRAFGFLRVHRSYVVNWAKASALVLKDRRNFLEIAETDIRIPVSRTKAAQLRRQLGGK
ncbi:MAG: LytTR family DNA-binding domain-containing protein [Pseudomonadota bacterium]